MLKYAMKWEWQGKTGCTFFVNDGGHEFKIDESTFNSIECPNLGFKRTFYDKEKKTTNVSFSQKAD